MSQATMSASSNIQGNDKRPSPLDILTQTQSGGTVVEDFRPLADSLDWKLGRLYWDYRGAKAFLSDSVPFLINNDGSLSQRASLLLMANLQGAEKNGCLEKNISVLELGVGTGLFARYFLDSFKGLCKEHNRDYYERLMYIAADRSREMLKDADQHGILSRHDGHYQLLLYDAEKPQEFAWPGPGQERQMPGPFRAVFLNYVLDTLPSAVLRLEGTQIHQLVVRTCVARGVKINDHLPNGVSNLSEWLQSADMKTVRDLETVADLFTLHCDFRPADFKEVPYGEVLARVKGLKDGYLIHNYGAMRCLDHLLTRLHSDGFMLINDYGSMGIVSSDEPDIPYQRYGGSRAMGLNFPLLQSVLEAELRCQWIEPDGDTGHICSRIVGRNLSRETTDCFREVFGKAAVTWAQQPSERARALRSEGRLEAATTQYADALRRQPMNWSLMGEVADFLTLTIADYQAGCEMAQAALALNPISPHLWNAYGDSLFYLNRTDEAYQAFLKALELSPEDVRAHYNLIYVHTRKKQYSLALKMVAEALLYDQGEYRERLLERQSEILERLSQQKRTRLRCVNDHFCRVVGQKDNVSPQIPEK